MFWKGSLSKILRFQWNLYGRWIDGEYSLAMIHAENEIVFGPNINQTEAS